MASAAEHEALLKVQAAAQLAQPGNGQWRNIRIQHCCGSPDKIHCTFVSGDTLFDASLFRGELLELEAYTRKKPKANSKGFYPKPKKK